MNQALTPKATQKKAPFLFFAGSVTGRDNIFPTTLIAEFGLNKHFGHIEET